MELMAVAALKAGADAECALNILDCVTTEEGYEYLVKAGVKDKAFEYILERILFYLEKRGGEDMKMECVLYSNVSGLLCESSGVAEILTR